MNEAIRQRRAMILLKARDMALDFLDGEDDPEGLPSGQIEQAISIHEPAISEIALAFEEALREAVAPQPMMVTAYLISPKGE